MVTHKPLGLKGATSFSNGLRGLGPLMPVSFGLKRNNRFLSSLQLEIIETALSECLLAKWNANSTFDYITSGYSIN
jgi:hypothetical protein